MTGVQTCALPIYSVTREQAMARLQRQAREQGLSLATQAARVVNAVEELARAAL